MTELLSGQFFAPLGRSTSHQLWSSAMVISPVIRGLFGLEWDAAGKKLMVTPSLPAQWDKAKLHHVPFAGGDLDLEMTRDGGMLVVRASGSSAQTVVLASLIPGAKWAANVLRIPLPAVEAGLSHGLPEAGSTTQQMKVLDQQYSGNSLTLTLSALARQPADHHASRQRYARKTSCRGSTNTAGQQFIVAPGASRFRLPAKVT